MTRTFTLSCFLIIVLVVGFFFFLQNDENDVKRQGYISRIYESPTESVAVESRGAWTEGDLILVSIVLNGSSVKEAPSGWIELFAVKEVQNPRVFTYYKTVTSEDAGTYEWILQSPVAASIAVAIYSDVQSEVPLQGESTIVFSEAEVDELSLRTDLSAAPRGSMLVSGIAINSSKKDVAIDWPSEFIVQLDLEGKRQELADSLTWSQKDVVEQHWVLSGSRAAVGWLLLLRPE